MPSVRTGQPSSTLLTLADQVLQPGFHGTAAPDWIRRRLGDGCARSSSSAPTSETARRPPRSPMPCAPRTPMY